MHKVIVIPLLVWPLLQAGESNPKTEAMVISLIFLLLTIPISVYSVANHLSKYIHHLTFLHVLFQNSCKKGKKKSIKIMYFKKICISMYFIFQKKYNVFQKNL